MRVPERKRTAYGWRWAAGFGSLAVLAVGLLMWLVVIPTLRVEALSLSVNLTTDVADLGDTNGDGDFDAAETPDGVCDTDAGTAGSQCTLRAALFEASGNGDTADTITVSVSGTITIAATLPVGATTAANAPADNTTIDGGTLGNLVVTCGGAFDGFTVTGASNTIRDFVINGCTDGVDISGDTADSNTITSNRIGTNAAGTAAVANTNGVVIQGSADSNTVSNNLISGNTTAGVSVTGAATDGNTIRGNLIGTDVNGSGALANGDGVADASASGTIIGGTTTANRNTISGNTDDGIALTGTSATVQGNCIGTTSDCATPRPNGGDGIDISGTGASNLIGGTVAGAGNIIQFNVDAGVEITGTGDFNRVTRNTIALNGGLGIMCGTAAAGCDGISPNENVGNPTITGCADAGSGNVTCSGTTAAGIAGEIIDVYRANVDGGGPEGQSFLCTTTTGAGGAWGCTFANPGGGSATATTTTAALSTSEFSAVAGIPPGVAPTATSAATNTPTPGTPTATPTRTATPTATPGGPTPTPTTGPQETVALVVGCNFEPWTGSTISPADLAARVTGTLRGLWAQQPAPIWKGFNPLFPAASDLEPVVRLKVVAFCMDSSGSFTRPII